ncbi:6-pyruvoyl-tetrahydropterin synthase [Sutterella wadsworthensis CAG:135]|nr:6-pyruvoyl-tetrahydropterin synthase [Sutterella wadsworthensis CAG:135]
MACVGKGFEKFRCALRLWRREKRFRRILFNDMAVFEKDNAVGDGPRKFHFVRDDHHGETAVGQLHNDVEHLTDHFRVKRGGHFVKKHHARVHGERADNGRALFLSA